MNFLVVTLTVFPEAQVQAAHRVAFNTNVRGYSSPPPQAGGGLLNSESSTGSEAITSMRQIYQSWSLADLNFHHISTGLVRQKNEFSLPSAGQWQAVHRQREQRLQCPQAAVDGCLRHGAWRPPPGGLRI